MCCTYDHVLTKIVECRTWVVQHQRKSMLARTKNGQPVLKNMMANLLSKLAK